MRLFLTPAKVAQEIDDSFEDLMEIKPPFKDPDVEAAFASFPVPARKGLLALRSLIFETAETTPQVGALKETLKWGQPAYVTAKTVNRSDD